MNRPTVISSLAVWTLVVLTAGAGALVIEGDQTGDAPVGTAAEANSTTSTTTAAATGRIPATGQVRVAGPIGAFAINGRLSATVPTPLTFEPVERGSGNGGELQGVLVADSLTSVVWDGGRSLVVEGDGGFTFDAALITLADGSLSAAVGGVVADVGPGAYEINAPVAVGRGGLAQPRDRVDFTVGATESPTASFRGAVTVDLPDAVTMLLGPGDGTLEGEFEVSRPDGSLETAGKVSIAADGQFEISVTPFEGGWIVDALIQGTVAVE